jgi:hypothetical protein
MSARVLRFPPRRMAAVFVCQERAGEGWLALAGPYGWLHGTRDAALEDAREVAASFGIPVREPAA